MKTLRIVGFALSGTRTRVLVCFCVMFYDSTEDFLAARLASFASGDSAYCRCSFDPIDHPG